MYLALNINANNTASPQGFPGYGPYYADNLFDELRLGVIFAIAQNSNINQAIWTSLAKNYTTCTVDNGVSLSTLKSGNGAMFQAFLPSIFLKESDWSRKTDGSLDGFGVALKNFALIQDYFARNNGLPALLSSAMNPYAAGEYGEFGVGAIATFPASENVCAPYASALAYLVDPSLAINLLSGLGAVGADTPFGFKDAIALNGQMSNRKLALDDAMIVLALQGNVVGTYVERYFTSIGKIDTVKSLYKNVLNLSDQPVGTQVPLTQAQEALRKSLQAEHFLAFKDIVDVGTSWVHDNFNIQSGWSAGGFLYDKGVSLSALGQNIIIGVKGDEKRIKFEVTDSGNKKAFVYLDGVSAAKENIYAIPLSSLQAQGVNLADIKNIYFVVEAVDKTGTVEISRTAKPMLISPSSNLTTANINIPGQGVDYPATQGLAPVGSAINAESTERGIKLVYDTKSGANAEWAGGGFSYTASAAGSVDISAYSQLVLGIKGNSDINGRVKFEIKDSNDHSAYVYLDGVDLNKEKIWAIPVSSFSGVNLSSVKYMYFIVEGSNRAGTLYVNRVKSSQWIPPATTTPDPAPNLPTANKSTYGVAASPATATITGSSASGFKLSYNTSTVGWAGASFVYNPTVNMSSFDSLSFRMSGSSASRIKFEIKDSIGGKFSLYLNGITGTSQAWSIQKSLISGIDWTKIEEFNFIIEGMNQDGTLDVTSNP
jgi:hypothetical protein